MKALIKNGNAIPEPFDAWTEANLKWLTGKDGTKGDGWKLVHDYVPPVEETPASCTRETTEEQTTAIAEGTPSVTASLQSTARTVEINGVELSVEDARKLGLIT